ncbi:MAG: 30S ribosome-binding factor RbfA [Bacteroidales bacterium]|jgi:ribosome-binding factor A|nr:30S ribosome-binding factor RbfA [Bacteroidales bacterium]
MTDSSTRQLKVSRLIQKELAGILLKQGRYIYGSAIVTVTKVEISKDFFLAKIMVSIYATRNKQTILLLLEENKKDIRYRLGQRIKRQVRIIPELTFVMDDTLDYIENIDNLLKS